VSEPAQVFKVSVHTAPCCGGQMNRVASRTDELPPEGTELVCGHCGHICRVEPDGMKPTGKFYANFKEEQAFWASLPVTRDIS